MLVVAAYSFLEHKCDVCMYYLIAQTLTLRNFNNGGVPPSGVMIVGGD